MLVESAPSVPCLLLTPIPTTLHSAILQVCEKFNVPVSSLNLIGSHGQTVCRLAYAVCFAHV